MTTQAPYTRNTLNAIRTMAKAGRTRAEVARHFGWTESRLQRACERHAVTFEQPADPTPPIPELVATAGTRAASCARCGKPFLDPSTRRPRLRCDPCRLLEHRERNREFARRYYAQKQRAPESLPGYSALERRG